MINPIFKLANKLIHSPKKNEDSTSSLDAKNSQTLKFILDKFSELANLQSDEFITYNHGRFHKHKNTLCNRLLHFFDSSHKPLNKLDRLIIQCAETTELLRLSFDPKQPNLAIQLTEKQQLLQQLHSTLSTSLPLSLNNLKSSSNAPDLIQRIQLLQNKIHFLSDQLVSINNSISSFKQVSLHQTSLESVFHKSTSDSFIERYIANLLQNKIDPDPTPHYFPIKSAVNTLSNIFGDKATQSIIRLYALDSNYFISSLDLKALIKGILANMTLEDLHIVCRSENKHLWVLAKTAQGVLEINSSPNVEFLKYLRGITLLSKEDLNQLKMYKPPYLNQLNKDLYFLKNCYRIDTYQHQGANDKTDSLKHFGYAEYLARNIAYGVYPLDDKAAIREGTLVPVPCENGQTCLMQAHTLHNQKGLYAVVLVPAEIDSNNYSQTVPVQILFRGSRNTAAWNRNLNPREKMKWNESSGPGARSFDNNSDHILANLEKILEKLPRSSPLKLEIFGHSLGACDGERMCEALAAKIHTSRTQHPQPKNALYHKLNIQEINLFGFNSPGIEPQLNTSFRQHASQLSDIKFQLRYFKAHHDPVQTVGKHLLGYREEGDLYPSNILTSVFHFTKPLNGKNILDNYLLNPHSQYNLSAVSDTKRKTPNDVWIRKVKTNNPQDAGIKFYDLDPTSPPSLSSIDHEIANTALFIISWGHSLRHLLLQAIHYTAHRIRLFLHQLRRLLAI